MPMQYYFKRQSSIHHKSHHILVERLSDNIISPACSRKYVYIMKEQLSNVAFLEFFFSSNIQVVFCQSSWPAFKVYKACTL